MTIKRDTIRDLSARFRVADAVQTTDEERRALPRDLQDVVAAIRASGHHGMAVHAERAAAAPTNEVDVHLDAILGVMHDQRMTEI